jgi:hypothetical protein
LLNSAHLFGVKHDDLQDAVSLDLLWARGVRCERNGWLLSRTNFTGCIFA